MFSMSELCIDAMNLGITSLMFFMLSSSPGKYPKKLPVKDYFFEMINPRVLEKETIKESTYCLAILKSWMQSAGFDESRFLHSFAFISILIALPT